jgi:hypothetical protein
VSSRYGFDGRGTFGSRGTSLARARRGAFQSLRDIDLQIAVVVDELVQSERAV